MKLPSTRVLVSLVVAAVAIAGVFAFGVFEIQSAFIDKEVAEAPPDFGDAGSVPLSTTTESTVDDGPGRPGPVDAFDLFDHSGRRRSGARSGPSGVRRGGARRIGIGRLAQRR